MHRSAPVLLAILTLGIFTASLDAQDADTTAQLETLRARVAELERENAALRAQLGEAQQQQQTLTREKQALVQQTEDLAAERSQLEKLAGVTARGEAVESAAALVESTYDEGRGVTRVSFKPRRLATTGTGPFSVDHFLAARYEFAGQTMQTPPAAVDVLLYTFMHPTNVYSTIREVDAIIDGSESLTIPLVSYEVVKTRRPAPSLKNGQTRYDEVLTLTLDTETLRRLSLAQREVILKLPGNDLVLERDHLAILAGARHRIGQGL